MLFSIVVPVYNVEKYLRQCVDSILAQDFKDYELILVDDGSTDESGKICDEYAVSHSSVKTLHQKNGGQATARNNGTSIAQGEYIVYLDSDDYICSSEFLTKVAQKTNDAPDVIFYGYKKLYDKSNTFGADVCAYPQLDGKKPEEAIKLLLDTDMYDGSPWTKAVKKEFLDRCEVSFVPGMISEDSDWFLQVVTRATTYTAINEVFVAYRQREGSTSHAPKVKSLTDNLGMLERWPQKFEEYKLSDSYKSAMMSVLARYYVNMLILYTRFEKKQVNEYYKRVKQLKYLLKYSISKRAKTVKRFCRIFGVRFTLFILKMLNKIRKS